MGGWVGCLFYFGCFTDCCFWVRIDVVLLMWDEFGCLGLFVYYLFGKIDLSLMLRFSGFGRVVVVGW